MHTVVYSPDSQAHDSAKVIAHLLSEIENTDYREKISLVLSSMSLSYDMRGRPRVKISQGILSLEIEMEDEEMMQTNSCISFKTDTLNSPKVLIVFESSATGEMSIREIPGSPFIKNAPSLRGFKAYFSHGFSIIMIIPSPIRQLREKFCTYEENKKAVVPLLKVIDRISRILLPQEYSPQFHWFGFCYGGWVITSLLSYFGEHLQQHSAYPFQPPVEVTILGTEESKLSYTGQDLFSIHRYRHYIGRSSLSGNAISPKELDSAYLGNIKAIENITRSFTVLHENEDAVCSFSGAINSFYNLLRNFNSLSLDCEQLRFLLVPAQCHGALVSRTKYMNKYLSHENDWTLHISNEEVIAIKELRCSQYFNPIMTRVDSLHNKKSKISSMIYKITRAYKAMQISLQDAPTCDLVSNLYNANIHITNALTNHLQTLGVKWKESVFYFIRNQDSENFYRAVLFAKDSCSNLFIFNKNISRELSSKEEMILLLRSLALTNSDFIHLTPKNLECIDLNFAQALFSDLNDALSIHAANQSRVPNVIECSSSLVTSPNVFDVFIHTLLGQVHSTAAFDSLRSKV